ncbi:disulfide isomerase DsbC N-terminal domain-containing protein [Desulfurobacterium sp.]
MRVGKCALILSFVLAGTCANAKTKAEIETLIRQKFPGLSFQKVEKSPVKGLWEVVAGKNVIYIDDDAEHLVIGMIYDRKGKNLTEEALAKAKNTFLRNFLKGYPEDAVHIPGKRKPTVLVVADLADPQSRFFLKELLRKGIDFKLILVAEKPQSLYLADVLLSSKDKKEVLSKILDGKFDTIKGGSSAKTADTVKHWRNFVSSLFVSVPYAVTEDGREIKNFEDIKRTFPVNFKKFAKELKEYAPVVVGSGKGKQVVVVTDPLCPFCRRACNALRKYAMDGKATFYVYFLPVHGRRSRQFIADILNSKKADRPKLLAEIFEGKVKATGVPLSPQAEKELKKELELVRKLGTTGTPTFYFLDSGKVIVGARVDKIKEILTEGER